MAAGLCRKHYCVFHGRPHYINSQCKSYLVLTINLSPGPKTWHRMLDGGFIVSWSTTELRFFGNAPGTNWVVV